jgi:hypothetical protein
LEAVDGRNEKILKRKEEQVDEEVFCGTVAVFHTV